MREQKLRKLIEEEIKRRDSLEDDLFVVFDCPRCKHPTIATKKYFVDWDALRPEIRETGVGLPGQEYWDDRQCLVCGNIFQLKTEEAYIDVSKEK